MEDLRIRILIHKRYGMGFFTLFLLPSVGVQDPKFIFLNYKDVF